MNPCKILLINGYKLLHEGISGILSADIGFKVFTLKGQNGKIIELIKKYAPNIILLDIDDLADRTDILANLVRQFPRTHVVALVTHYERNTFLHVLRMGVSGYLPTARMDEISLIRAIKVIAGGGIFIPPEATCILIGDYLEQVKLRNLNITRDKQKPPLTEREWEILRLLARGYGDTNKISHVLYISNRTTYNHINNILLKMNTNNRTHAVVTAVKNGWIRG